MSVQGSLVKARLLQAVVFDWDGVFTDNCELIGFADNSIVKARSHYDGQGVSLLRDIGLKIAIATNESGDNARAANFLVNKWNNLPSTNSTARDPWCPVKLFTGVGHDAKAEAVMQWLREINVMPSSCAAMGDDMVDVPLLKLLGFKAAPITAEQVIKDMADYVSVRPAGHGAVRDFANFILAARGIDPTSLRPF